MFSHMLQFMLHNFSLLVPGIVKYDELDIYKTKISDILS